VEVDCAAVGSMGRSYADVGGVVANHKVEGQILGGLSVLLLGEARQSLEDKILAQRSQAVPVEADGTQIRSSEGNIGGI
jgi:hypothetical protein